MKKEKRNAKEWPKKYKAKFFEAGLCNYEDSNDGVILMRKETIDKMLPSIIGKPIVNDHQNVSPSNIKDHSVGYVSDAWFNDKDGWYYADFIVDDDEARKKIENDKCSVSCAYSQFEESDGGSYHATDYDYEITDGEFTHLALVDNPRYEDAKIFLNSKNPKKGNSIMKFFRNKKEEMEGVDLTASYALIDDKEVPMQELINTYSEAAKKAKENEKQMMNDEDEVDVDGEIITVKALKDAYSSMMENAAADEEEKENEGKSEDEDEKENASEEDEKENECVENEEEKKEEKKNSFKKLKKAHKNSGKKLAMPSLNLKSERIAEGQARYGSLNKIVK